MKLHEFQSKAILARHGVPVPRGQVAVTADAAGEVARRLGGRVAVKAQVLVGGRGKAGGILLAGSPAEARERAARILGLMVGGLAVTRVLVEEAAQIERELYLGLVVDRAAGCVTLVGSGEGGVEIEEVARRSPASICRLGIDAFLGLQEYHLRYLGSFLGLPPATWPDLAAIARALYAAFLACDASLAEINPLVLTTDGRLLALDAKINLDDNALYRHPDLEALRNPDEESAEEALARDAGLSYVSLGGNIGCLVNGAGLAMATLDAVRAFGGLPADFLDVGGGARADRVAAALGIILRDAQVRAVLLNIFGGITRCDEVAEGVVQALASTQPDLPIVARLTGTNEAEGQAILSRAAGVQTARSLSEAARLAVSLAGSA